MSAGRARCFLIEAVQTLSFAALLLTACEESSRAPAASGPLRVDAKAAREAQMGEQVLPDAGGSPDELVPAKGGALECFDRARLLRVIHGDGNAYLLCRGASSVAPVDCYVEAERRTQLGVREMFELCRCARSTGPIDCYQRARHDSFLDDREIVELCNPITTFGLRANCTPGCSGSAP